MSNTTIGNGTSILIAISGMVSAVIIYKQASFMKIQNEIANRQRKSSNRILKMEVNRDRQANLVTVWTELEWTASDTKAKSGLPLTAHLVATIYLLNASRLPVYDADIKITREQNGVRMNLPTQVSHFTSFRPTVAPAEKFLQIWTFKLEWIAESQGVPAKLTGFSADNSEGKYGKTFDTSGYRFDDFKTLGVTMRFRCVDGTIWTRDEKGYLMSERGQTDKVLSKKKRARWGLFRHQK